jgi:hypothetical protein
MYYALVSATALLVLVVIASLAQWIWNKFRYGGTPPPGSLWVCPNCNDRNYWNNNKCGSYGLKRPKKPALVSESGKPLDWDSF